MKHQTLSTITLLTGLLPALTGCSQRNTTVIGGPDAQEAAIRMEESRQEYSDCVASLHPGAPTCDRLKALYDKDKDEYEAQVQ